MLEMHLTWSKRK